MATELPRCKGQCDDDSSLEGENGTINNRDVSGGDQDEEADDGWEEEFPFEYLKFFWNVVNKFIQMDP